MSGTAVAHNIHTASAALRRSELLLPNYSTVTFVPFPVEPWQACGCESLATLRSWFPSPLGVKALEELDATLCAFEARDDDVIVCDVEVLFNRLTATFLWNVPASMLHCLTDEEAMTMPRRDRIFLEPDISLCAPINPTTVAAA